MCLQDVQKRCQIETDLREKDLAVVLLFRDLPQVGSTNTCRGAPMLLLPVVIVSQAECQPGLG